MTQEFTEFYRRNRPQSPKELVGQKEAVATVGGLARNGGVPHAILLSGPSGCGKTTIARMMSKMLKCGDGDYTEVNSASTRGIDFIRNLQQAAQMLPISGNVRIWVIDEAHQLSKDAQEAFLKLLEDQPKHAYFFLCTTDPGKLKKTIITRCTEIKLKEIAESDLVGLVANVAEKEKVNIEEEVVLKIASMADGSARKALVLLQQVSGIPTKEGQLEALLRSDASIPTRTLAQALLNGGKIGELTEIIKTIEEAEAEGTRIGVLRYALAVFLNSKGGNKRALAIMEAFQFDVYTSGKAGLAIACNNVVKS